MSLPATRFRSDGQGETSDPSVDPTLHLLIDADGAVLSFCFEKPYNGAVRGWVLAPMAALANRAFAVRFSNGREYVIASFQPASELGLWVPRDALGFAFALTTDDAEAPAGWGFSRFAEEPTNGVADEILCVRPLNERDPRQNKRRDAVLAPRTSGGAPGPYLGLAEAGQRFLGPNDEGAEFATEDARGDGPYHYRAEGDLRDFAYRLSPSIAAKRGAIGLTLAHRLDRLPWANNAIKAHARVISKVFDPAYYVRGRDDSDAAISNPLLHYVLIGWRRGRQPHILFDVEYYRSQKSCSDTDPLLDYLRFGDAEGLNPHPLIDVSYYKNAALDGVHRETSALEHYLEIGARAGLDPSAWFKGANLETGAHRDTFSFNPLIEYLENRLHHDADVMIAFDARLYRYQVEIERGRTLEIPPLVDYLKYGFRDQSIMPNILFDAQFYCEHAAVPAEMPALCHYLQEGERLGLGCHPRFSSKYYNTMRTDDDDGLSALEHALSNPRSLHASDPSMGRPIDARIFDFVNSVVSDRQSFDAENDDPFNDDRRHLERHALTSHYLHYGNFEKHASSARDVVRRAGIRIRDIELGFVVEDYIYFNPDVVDNRTSFHDYFSHYLLHGRNEKGRLIGRWQLNCDGLTLRTSTPENPLVISTDASRKDICVILHVYYPDILDELMAFAANFRTCRFDIFINIVDTKWTPEINRYIRQRIPNAFVQMSNDAGRDVGGLVRLLDNVVFDNYELIAFMHSKKSPHIAPERGDYWRKSLLRAFAGAPDIAEECVALFRDEPRVGMICAREWRSSDMGNNKEQYQALLRTLGIEPATDELDYVAGFMFATRSVIMERLHGALRHTQWESASGKGLEFHLDGQIAHGVERALPALVRDLGYQIMFR